MFCVVLISDALLSGEETPVSLTPPLFPLQAAGVTYDAPDKAIVIGMSARAEPLVQTVIELVFPRLGQGSHLNGDTQSSQAGRRYQNEQGTIGQTILRQIGQALFDKFLSWQ
jgi:hypothetical protein